MLSQSKALCSYGQLHRTTVRHNRLIRVLSPLSYCVGVGPTTSSVRCGNHGLPRFSTIVPHVNATVAFCKATTLHRFRVLKDCPLGRSITVTQTHSGLHSVRLLTHRNVSLPIANVTRSPSSADSLVSVINNTPLIIGLIRNARKVNIILTRAHRTTRDIVSTFHNLGTRVLIRRCVGRTRKYSVHYLIINSRIITTVRQQTGRNSFHSGLRHNNTTDITDVAPRRHRVTVGTTQAVTLSITNISVLHTGHKPLIVRIGTSPKLRKVRGAANVSVTNGVVH